MKIRLLLCLCLLAGIAMQAQDIDITGTWTMYEMAWTSGQDVNKTTEEQIKDQGMITDYFFMPEGEFKLVSNMTGSGNMETAEGNWKLEGNQLTCSIPIGENLVDIVWDFELKDEVINLRRSSPDGSTSVVNSFKRK